MDAVGKLRRSPRNVRRPPDNYDIDGKRVFRKGSPGTGMTYGQAAQRAIELGGRYDGHELPKDINPMTQGSATAIAGTGLVGVAKDNLPVAGQPSAFAVGFVQIELDTETGKYQIIDYVGVADCGTVIHPAGLETQVKSGAVQGFGIAGLERIVYDPQVDCPRASGSTRPSRPPTATLRAVSGPPRSTSRILPVRSAPRASVSRCWAARRRPCCARCRRPSAGMCSTALRWCPT
jgi:hypothetical protein